MNFMTPPGLLSEAALSDRLALARRALRPPPSLDLIKWADGYRRVANKTSAQPGQWRTSSQPVAFGPMAAHGEPDTHTISAMAATQVLKTELLINIAGFHVHQDPASVLFVQPTQGAAAAFSKERFAPTVEASPVLAGLIAKPLWTGRSTRSKHNDPLWLIGTNAAKDAIQARLRIPPPELGQRQPGFIHFPLADSASGTEAFGPEYFEQLTAERREIRYRSGQPYVVWYCPPGKRNEAFDTMVGALAVRRSLPRRFENLLEYGAAPQPGPTPPSPSAQVPSETAPVPAPAARPARPSRPKPFLQRQRGWLSKGR